MSELRRIVERALHDTRDGGTAVLSGGGSSAAVVQWISFGADGIVVEVPDPDRHRPGPLARLFGRSRPAAPGLGRERIDALERLGFTGGEHGPELSVGPGALGHDQLVAAIVGALDAVGIHPSDVSVEVFDTA